METITDNKWRNFKYHWQLPAKMQEEYKSDEYLDGWVKYKRAWYHISDFMTTPNAMNEWEGIVTETYFSGVVIKVSRDCESYKIGSVYS